MSLLPNSMRKILPIIGGMTLVASLHGAEIPKEQAEFFEKKIRPILAENCYKCHSVEAGKSKGGLTLDTREATLKGGEGGPAVTPGNPAKSLLITAVTYQDKDLQMPPKKDASKLPDDQIADLIAWVKMGAPDPRDGKAKAKLTGLSAEARAHWSYQPVKKPAIPAVRNRAWCVTPVDAFILHKIEAKGMVPSPPADKETLLRRATYDLIGLPPTPAEIEAFLKDQSPTAFATVIDRLLASPHYGERWGRFWLDSARYADTSGDRGNNMGMDYRFPYAWTYRDYVIRSFNDDKPYDRFVLEQLAADKLPDLKDQRDLAALGFITVGDRTGNANDVINDRIDTVSKGFLGMTVACARCHDHKFDPIPTKDYYAMHGIFNSIEEPKEKPVISYAKSDDAIAFQSKISALEQKNRDTYYRVVDEKNGQFRQKASGYIRAWYLGRRGATDEEQLRAIAVRTEEKLDNDVSQAVGGAIGRNDSIFAPLHAFQSGKWEEIATGKISKLNPIVAAAMKGSRPYSIDDLADLYEKMFIAMDAKAREFVKLSAETKGFDAKVTGAEPGIAELASLPLHVTPANYLTGEQLRKEMDGWPQGLQNIGGGVYAQINELKLTNAGSDARAMVVTDSKSPTDSAVFIRGQAGVRGDVVPRRFLEVLSGGNPKPFKIGSGRLELAQSIASKANPLTARVIVNRVWLHHFGEGFVRTPDDLGTMAEAPSHPELIDYLSSYLMDQGWSLKRLHKLIMLSKVYQNSSHTIPAYEQIDPDNRLLWRANVRRLDFEAMRDSLLVFSGKLDETVGGQPVNLTDEPYSNRRSVYGYIDRGNLPELMAHFDFSNPEAPNSKRSTTIVPQQALFLMNSAMSIDVARSVLTRPTVVNSTNNLNRVFNIYRIMFQRAPTKDEIQWALEFVGKETKDQPQVVASAKEMVDKANKKVAEREKRASMPNNDARSAIRNQGEFIERKPLTPWETMAHALLLSNETAYIN